ncbi:hypothetical protein F2Q68_00041236 [Brassica cretica]|uniref:Reverse transcriptase zinc-binding domain-containing protein n=2 Tax=Brassica cretica TaxID=69181 RepID=A0A8S9MF35_BRACR|nr:hypothetical protein F2Q68_00041236 [Brassica cretica]KAF3498409.1 hypothetical protein DY000_02055679 [Brassica cretica]
MWIAHPPSSLQAVAGILSSYQVVSSSGLPAVIKLLLHCIIYCVWRERNMHIFQQTLTTEAGVIARIDRLMRDQLISIPPSSASSPSPLLVYFRLPPFRFLDVSDLFCNGLLCFIFVLCNKWISTTL